MNWLRLYHSTLTSEKVQTLEDRVFKFWINCLIVASSNDPRGELPNIKEIAFKTNVRLDYARLYIQKLESRGLVERVQLTASSPLGPRQVPIRSELGQSKLGPSSDLDTYLVHDWEAYQPESDDVNKRVKRFRGKGRNVTKQEDETLLKRSRGEEIRREEKPLISPFDFSNLNRSILGSSPSEPELDEFSAWAEAVCDRHPKSTDRYLAQQALTEFFARNPRDRNTFDKNHRLWCMEQDWTKENGKWAPILAKWIRDKGWKRIPDQGGSTSDEESEIDRFTRETEEDAARALGRKA
jgi:hypothetical protein